MIGIATAYFKQGNQLKLSISCSNSENFNLRNYVGKRKSSKLALDFPLMVSVPVVITSVSEPLSTADGNGALNSIYSVSIATTNTNVSTPTTVSTTPQVATENRLSVIEKSIACLGDTLTRFVEGQKRPSSSTSSRQRHQSRSRHRDHCSYYRNVVRDHHKDSVKAAGIIKIISMVVDGNSPA